MGRINGASEDQIRMAVGAGIGVLTLGAMVFSPASLSAGSCTTGLGTALTVWRTGYQSL
jgi:hypothetical protein